MYRVVFTRQAMKDRRLIAQAGLERRAKALLDLLAEDPLKTPPPCEKLAPHPTAGSAEARSFWPRLVGDLAGFYSRRINLQHRLVYSVHPEEGVVKILRLWTHYE